jgi:hypothetical protein
MSMLNLVHPKKVPGAAEIEVDVTFGLRDGDLAVEFSVKGSPARVNPTLAMDRSQWGLWDWDVVEVFLRLGESPGTYYEFQVSPKNQYFELEVFEPRKRFNREFASGFGHRAAITENGWHAEMRIPISKLGWDGNPESVYGNSFAVLGEAEQKTYWSQFLTYQEKPDFHLPEFFRPLLTPSGLV